jgi:hypothetical protein
MKLNGWEKLLDEFFISRRDTPFAWGANDCVLFAADAVVAMTGTDFAGQFRGKYATATAADSTLRDAGYASILHAVADKLKDFKAVDWKYAGRGDVVLFELDGRQTLGIVALDGRTIFGPGVSGIERFPLKQATQAWKL